MEERSSLGFLCYVALAAFFILTADALLQEEHQTAPLNIENISNLSMNEREENVQRVSQLRQRNDLENAADDITKTYGYKSRSDIFKLDEQPPSSINSEQLTGSSPASTSGSVENPSPIQTEQFKKHPVYDAVKEHTHRTHLGPPEDEDDLAHDNPLFLKEHSRKTYSQKTILNVPSAYKKDLKNEKVLNLVSKIIQEELSAETASKHPAQQVTDLPKLVHSFVNKKTKSVLQDTNLTSGTHSMQKNRKTADHITHNSKETSKTSTDDPNTVNSSTNPTSTSDVPITPVHPVLVVSLGGGEDELFAVNTARLLAAHGDHVAALVYGTVREAAFPEGVQVLHVPTSPVDPLLFEDEDAPSTDLLMKNVGVGVSGDDAVGAREWAAGRVVESRVAACAGLPSVLEDVKRLQPSVIITPLWLHDVCTLALAERVGVPTVGVITSRIGAWWAWAHLGVLPDLSTASAPTGVVGQDGLLTRAANLAEHYAFLSTMRQRWQASAAASLPQDWVQTPLTTLYRRIQRLLVVWDPLVHPSPPHTPLAVPIGGFATELEPITKDVLVSALLNRAGIIAVQPGGREVWVGADAINAIYRALAALPYTVLWATPHSHLRPHQGSSSPKAEDGRPDGNVDSPTNEEEDALRVTKGEVSETDKESEENESRVEAKFIFKNNIPLNGILAHPRHRLLISPCGETDVMAAAHFASPVLCVPVTPDQLLAAGYLRELGVAEVVPAWEATVESIEDALRELFKSRRYRLRARELAEDLHDQPLSPTDRLLYHVQHTVRRPHSRRYQIVGSNLPLHQQSNADVYLLLLAVLLVLTLVLLVLVVLLAPVLTQRVKRKQD